MSLQPTGATAIAAGVEGERLSLERERILQELILAQQLRVQNKRAELRALKTELSYLNTEETDLRRIFAAERTRFSSLPRFWALFVLTHLVFCLNAWHRVRLGPYAEGGSSADIGLFAVHLFCFLMFWRRLYYPGQRFNVPFSLWVLCMHWYAGAS